MKKILFINLIAISCISSDNEKNMIENYKNNPQLFEKCINLIDEVFPGCKQFALNGIKYKASWPNTSTPFIVKKDGEVIAHAGVWPITLMLNGQKHVTGAIHGVCVKPDERGKGYFNTLMQEAIEYVENNFESSILFTDKPYLYKKYPYKIMFPEYDFVMKDRIKTNSSNISDLRVLDLDDPNDLNLIYDLISRRVPLSNNFSIVDNSELFVLNAMNKKLYYSKKLNVLISMAIVNEALYLKEIISPNQCQIIDILGLITEKFNKVILQFCPDKFLDEKDYEARLFTPECCLVVSENFKFDGKYFRFPELYWC